MIEPPKKATVRADAAPSVWAAVAPCPALVHLRNKVEAACVRAGAEPERRKFKPHVTLARVKGETGHHLADYLARYSLFAAGPFVVDHFTLYLSHRSSGGHKHLPEAKVTAVELDPEMIRLADKYFGMKPEHATREFIRLLRYGLLPRADEAAGGATSTSEADGDTAAGSDAPGGKS